MECARRSRMKVEAGPRSQRYFQSPYMPYLSLCRAFKSGSLFSLPPSSFPVVERWQKTSFRETLEAAIIVSVLLGLVEQIVHGDPSISPAVSQTITGQAESKNGSDAGAITLPDPEDDSAHRRLLIRKLRIQIFAGSALGLFIALAIGAAFIAVWFTKASDLWAKSETLWEGIFELIACIMIFIMGITMLKMDRAKAKWRVKLSRAFDSNQAVDGRTKTGKWVLFFLPFITVLREGMEAVVFVGGVSLGQSATSIPIAAIVGIICGLTCGFLIYQFASRSMVMTNFILLIGAGLFSKAVGAFEQHAFNTLLGADVDDAGGTGPGSYRVQGNVWHLDCCSPENKFDNSGWSIFSAIFGWTNNATLMVTLVYMKFKEGRTKVFGYESAAAARRRHARRIREGEGQGKSGDEENKRRGE
ncbi:hypothetical protein C0995_009412 [Termitomyces sp. Mi166|nr:hypothetical protein C0995_009412 [Termitomyces sp. Mi166\